MVMYLGGLAPLAAQTLDVQLAAVEHPVFSARQVTLRWTQTGQGNAAALEIGHLRLGTREWKKLHLRCGEFSWSHEIVRCRRGELQLGDSTPISRIPLEFSYQPDTQGLELTVQNASFATLPLLLPELAGWHLSGRFDARFNARATQLDGSLSLKEAAFGNAAGTQAGDKISATLLLNARRDKTGWAWQTSMDWLNGEWYIAPFYQNKPMRLTAAGQVTAQRWTIDQATWTLNDLGQVQGRLQWQPYSDKSQQPGRLLMAEVHSDPLDLAVLGAQWLQPWLDARAGPKLSLSGQVQVSAAFDAQGLQKLDMDLQNANLITGRHELKGLTTRIPWRRDAATQAHFRVAGGRFGALPMGEFEGSLAMNNRQFDLPQLAIPLLDGRLLLENLHIEQGADEWHWHLGAALEPIAMPQLTEAMGWPKMEGVLSAAIPRMKYANGTLTLDGQVMVSVFDGYLAFDDLKLIEPFGALPRLQADIMARHLDLNMMTRTFSFGDVTGYIDADVQGLVMAGMRPLAFDAMVHSTPGDYPKRISQRAVQNISSLGGAGAAAAIQRSFLQVFETFGYDRIGVRCRLLNGVCLMEGIEAPADRLDALASRLGISGGVAHLPSQGFVLIKGGGLPALNVIGYNRRVDWEELLARLKAAVAGNGKIELR